MEILLLLLRDQKKQKSCSAEEVNGGRLSALLAAELKLAPSALQTGAQTTIQLTPRLS